MADYEHVELLRRIAHGVPVSATLVAEAAGDYADNDVVSNAVANGTGDPIEFASAVRDTGGAGKIIGATIACNEDGILATSRLHLFSQAPTASEMDDNAAFSLGAADLPYYLGFVPFAAMADFGAGSFALDALTEDLLVRAAATTLYGILQFTDAETNETAGMIFTIVLYVA